MATFIRRLVSKKKKRFVEPENNFDLDLAYITPRIIAMGYPASKFESLYRNPASEVKRFLELKHPDAYMLWSLTAEPDRKYDYTMFHNRVNDQFQFWDHEAPPFDLMIPYCQSVDAWLNKDPKNVAVIHCKAGKGRTGVMISAYLLWSKQYPTAEKALAFYGQQRTLNNKGVTIPSQQRAVYYLEELLQKYQSPTPSTTLSTPFPGNKLKLRKIKVAPVPFGGCALGCFLYNPSFQMVYSNVHNNRTKLKKHTEEDSEIVITIGSEDAVLTKDIKFQFLKQEGEGKFKKCFHFWLNVEFIGTQKFTIQKKDMDKAYKDKKDKKFASNFHVELEFEAPANPVANASN